MPGPWLLVETPEHSHQWLPILKATSQACNSIWNLHVDLNFAENSKKWQNLPHLYCASMHKGRVVKEWGRHSWVAGSWPPASEPYTPRGRLAGHDKPHIRGENG